MIRQTPGRTGRWADHEFILDQEIDACDYWIVFSGLRQTETTRCPRENVIFIAGEPPGVTHYTRRFLLQFSKVIACHRQMQHPGLVWTQPCLPWHVGQVMRGAKAEYTLDYDGLKAATFNKTKLLSVVTSSQTQLPGHRKRLRFIETLREAFGDQIDVFGRGVREIADKWDGIAPYKYHVALENSCVADYWTEKLSDAFLGGAYPIYAGCPNIHDYFPVESLLCIDLDHPAEAIGRIKECLCKGTFEVSQAPIQQARELVLDQYNFFPAMAAMCPARVADGPGEMVTLRPEMHFWSVWQHLRYHVLGPMRQRVRKSLSV
jgi:hypothetical protein